MDRQDHFEQEITVYTEITVKLILEVFMRRGKKEQMDIISGWALNRKVASRSSLVPLTVDMSHLWSFKKICLLHHQNTSLGLVCVALVGIKAL